VLGQWRIGVAYRATGPHGAHTLLLAPLAKGRAATFRDWLRGEVERTRAARVSHALITVTDGGLHAEQEGFLILDRVAGPQRCSRRSNWTARFPTSARAAPASRSPGRPPSAHAIGLALGDLRPSTVLLSSEKPEALVLDMGMARGLSDYSRGRALAAPPPTARPSAILKVPAEPGGRRLRHRRAAVSSCSPSARRPRARLGESRVATPPSWAKKDEGVARYIDPVVLRAMSPRPSDRHTAAELADALGRAARGLPALPGRARDARPAAGPRAVPPRADEPVLPARSCLPGVPAAPESVSEPSVDGILELSGEFEALNLPDGVRLLETMDDEPPIIAPPPRRRP
jgi:hypothetical protein